MFSISQTSSGFFCLEWSSTENGPLIDNLNHIKIKSSFKEDSMLEKIISSCPPSIKDESNSLSITLNSNDILISSIDVFHDKENDKIISWYESNIMGKDFCENYYNYYYPMFCNDTKRFLTVSLPKKIKQNILDSSKKLGFNLIYLSVDIFSAAILAQNIYKKETLGEYIIWKICENNSHVLALYDRDRIKAFIRLKKSSNEFVDSYSVGSKEDIDMVVQSINKILTYNKT